MSQHVLCQVTSLGGIYAGLLMWFVVYWIFENDAASFSTILHQAEV